MVYQWKSGFHNVGKIPPEVAGEVFEQLSSENRLTAKNLVEVSRPEDAPLHNAFEWNDSEAAERWREQQGRNLINSIVIRADDVEDSEPVRAFFVLEKKTGEYKPTTVIMRDEDLRQKLFETAKRELAAFRAKYKALEAFDVLIREIDKVLEAS